MRITEFFLRGLFRRWRFLVPPDEAPDDKMVAAFERLWRSISSGCRLIYDLPYAKTAFTRWLTAEKGVLLHGSNHAGLEQLLPRKQTNFSGKPVEAVFASSDGIWSLYFALLDYQNPNLSTTRNGCFSLFGEMYYIFCVNQEALEFPLWTSGWVYIVPPDGFVSQDPEGLWRSEWICDQTVRPLAALPVSYEDFPFYQHVAGFPRGEHFLLTWARYGRRIGK